MKVSDLDRRVITELQTRVRLGEVSALDALGTVAVLITDAEPGVVANPEAVQAVATMDTNLRPILDSLIQQVLG